MLAPGGADRENSSKSIDMALICACHDSAHHCRVEPDTDLLEYIRCQDLPKSIR